MFFSQNKKSLNRDPSDPLSAIWGISAEEFEEIILIFFIMSTILYFSVIFFLAGKSQKFFRGQNALITSLLNDYDIIYYVSLYDDKLKDEAESYHFSDTFKDIFD